MRELAFLLALEVPSLSCEYKDSISEELFTKCAITFSPPFIDRESNKETQCSFPNLEVVEEELITSTATCKAPKRRISNVPSFFSARVARIASESVTRSSFSDAFKMLTNKGICLSSKYPLVIFMVL